MTQDLDSRLKTALAERDRLVADAQRIAGRKEAAEKNLAEVEEEIRKKNLDPETLDDTIKQLREAFATAVADFERDLEAAREALTPFMEK
jgi:predicted  nucleic acid-binding Zn-ribbon protein